MDIEQFKTAWQERPPEGPLAQPTEDIMNRLLVRMQTFDRDIRWRDWRETAAAALVALFFGYAAWTSASALERIGSRIIVIGAILIPIVMHWTRQQRGLAPADESVRDYCEHQLARIDDQIRMLRYVAWWYLGPLMVGGLLFAAGRTHSLAWSLVQVGILGAVSAAVYYGNRWVVRNDLEPMREDLARHLQDLA